MKRKAIFLDDYILINNNKIYYQKLYSSEFICYSNDIVTKFNYGLIVDNIVFFRFILRMLSIMYYIKHEGIESADILIHDFEFNCIVSQAANNVQIPYSNIYSSHESLLHDIKEWGILALTYIYLLVINLAQFWSTSFMDGCDLWIVRSGAGKKRVFEKENTIVLEESRIGWGSIYRRVTLANRLRCLRRAYEDAKRERNKIDDVFHTDYYGDVWPVIKSYCSKRLVHALFWGNVIEEIVCSHKVSNIYSSNLIDIYAQVENNVALKKKVNLTIIPHGLENSFKYPAGLPGLVFFCTTEHAAQILNSIYKTNKFKYDKNICMKMFHAKMDNNLVKHKPKVVYFTESSVLDLKIIHFLIAFLKERGITLYIKIHPNADKALYSSIKGVLFEEDINIALDRNICVARVSTVLIEAMYHGSIPVRVLLEEDSDISSCLSLDDPKVITVRGFDGLKIQLGHSLAQMERAMHR